jgi:SH3-like domain-containing protein
MAARHVSALLALGIAVSAQTALLTNTAFAQEIPQAEEKVVPQVDNAKHQFLGEINQNAVYVRSGPSNNFYPTVKLEKGDPVTVVGIKYDWLKIVPPAGSFSYVPKAYVTRRGDGKVGRVNQTANVRAGSSLNAIKTTVQMRLDEGQDVTILGEQDEYFKVAPPEGAYLYVNQQYVNPVKPTDEPAIAKGEQSDDAEVARDVEPAEPGTNVEPAEPAALARGEQPEASDEADVTTTPAPETQPTPGAVADATPAAKPAPAVVAEDFRKLEAEFETASERPIIEQPIEQLTERYTTLAQSGTLGGTTKKVVEARLVALKMRAEARAELINFREKKEATQQKMLALEEERREISDRIAQTQVDLFTAVGTLRVSSLQRGAGGTLYRLTDPATGRTIVYVRSADPKYALLLDQFVGVRGDLRTDERLRMKIITPNEAEPVEQSKVNNTVIATITPPSMLPLAATVDQATTAGE